MIAAPTVTGLLDTKEESFSLAKTPGDIKVSAIVVYILFCYKYGRNC
jgi:hypothetical protein